MEMARTERGRCPDRAAVAQRFDDGAEVRLRSEARHRIDGAIDGVAAAATAASTLAAAMPEVSCVWKCTGISSSSLSALTSVYAAFGLAQPGHVLDAENVRAGSLQLAAHLEVVVERVLGFRGARTGCRCSRSAASTQLAGFEHASMATRMLSTQLSESKRGTRRRRERGLLHEGAHHVVG
jgi:hypothetical protein